MPATLKPRSDLARRRDRIRVPVNKLPGISLQPIDAGDTQRDRRRASAPSAVLFPCSTWTTTARSCAQYIATSSKLVASPPGMRAAALARVALTLARPRANGPNGLPHVVVIRQQSHVAAAVPLQHRVECGVIPRNGVFECACVHIVLPDARSLLAPAGASRYGAVHRYRTNHQFAAAARPSAGAYLAADPGRIDGLRILFRRQLHAPDRQPCREIPERDRCR